MFKNKQNFKDLLKEKHITRAIPGGMYGCAILAKFSKNEILNKTSIGRVLALVKKALKDQILIHYKTLIIKDNSKDTLSEETKQKLIKEAKNRVINILAENLDEGVPLA